MSASAVLYKAHSALLWAGGIYGLFLLAISMPSVQRSFIFLHQLRFPWGADFAHPEAFGFSRKSEMSNEGRPTQELTYRIHTAGKVLPLTLTTPDGATLGAWQCLPDDIYNAWVLEHGVPEEGSLPQEVFDAALASEEHPTVLYQHGNAGTRAAANRVNVARYMTAGNYNFLIYDYRGFADSSSTPPPSERGLVTDARAAWDYLTLAKKVPSSRIAVMGQSLGTGVTAGLVATLAEEQVTPRSVILVAPFSSIPALLETYRLGNLIPILAPFRSVPWAMDMFLRVLHTRFDTKAVIHKIQCPILILHALNDPVIPFSHSTTLFSHLSSSATPSSSLLTKSDKLIQETKAGGWGTVRRFARDGVHGDVVWAEAVKGAHNEIGTSEVSIRLIREMVSRA